MTIYIAYWSGNDKIFATTNQERTIRSMVRYLKGNPNTLLHDMEESYSVECGDSGNREIFIVSEVELRLDEDNE